MIGYNGIKILVDKTLSKVMEQVDGGNLILNKGEKEKPKSKHSSNKKGKLLSNKGCYSQYPIKGQQVAGVHQESP
ncbi:hypothetical protein BY996DRAFT_6861100, partial [Phakopsora pachyrhizi]